MILDRCVSPPDRAYVLQKDEEMREQQYEQAEDCKHYRAGNIRGSEYEDHSGIFTRRGGEILLLPVHPTKNDDLKMLDKCQATLIESHTFFATDGAPIDTDLVRLRLNAFL